MNLDSISEVLDQRAAEVLAIRNQLGTSIGFLISFSSHLILPSTDALWAEMKQRHAEELEAKYDTAVAAKDKEIAALTLSRNTIFTKLSERDAQIATQAKDIASLSARLEQAACAVGSRHAARSELGMTYDSFCISYLHTSLFSSIL